MPVRPANNVEVQDEGTSQGFVRALNFVGAAVVAAVAGSVATITVTGGGAATVTQASVTLPSPAKRNHAVVVTDAAVNGASKIMLSLAGAPVTAQNEAEDIEMLSMGALPAAGSFTFQAGFHNPISGPVLINYMVG